MAFFGLPGWFVTATAKGLIEKILLSVKRIVTRKNELILKNEKDEEMREMAKEEMPR